MKTYYRSGALIPFALLVLPLQATSQIPDSLTLLPPQEAEEELAELLQPVRVTPRGAFIRSALIPGWGHARAGAFGRGAFYVGVESVTAFMIFKTQTRVGRARDRRVLMEEVVTARLVAAGQTGLTAIEAALADDPVVEDLRSLEDVRSEQLEDWIALGIFFLMLGGADAYVSAHLADAPAALEIGGAPGGGVGVGVSIPVNF